MFGGFHLQFLLSRAMNVTTATQSGESNEQRGGKQRAHVLEVVERLCDRVAIIHDGKLVKSGTMAEMRTGSETLAETLDWL
jgi:ABC-type Na+ transport system ATPase subunit NatA